MSESYGYLLPPGDAFTQDVGCLIVYYPDRKEYRQALFGSLDYLGTWLAWERDDLKRGQDAARAWKIATALTRECFSMATCAEILALLTKIEFNTRQCCGETTYVSYQDNTVVTTVIVPGQGAPPTHYGETPVSDWDEWKEYVCYHAHLFVDDLIDTAEKLDIAATLGGYVLDFVAHLFSLVQWRMVEDIIPVNFSVIGAIIDALAQAGIQNEWATAAADFETAREDIVCALMQGNSLGDAVETALDGSILWTLYYQWLDYETTTAVIYEGQVPEIGYLPPVKRDDCECEAIPEGDIWGIAFDILWANSSHGNPSIPEWGTWDGVSMYFNPTMQYHAYNRTELGGSNVLDTPAGNPKTLVFGNAAARAAIAGDYEINKTPQTPGVQGEITISTGGNAGGNWFQYRAGNFKIFLSEDGGASGAWYDANIAYVRSDYVDSYDVTNNVVTCYSGTGQGTGIKLDLLVTKMAV